MGLEKQIRIAYDEWNLRAWYHPGVHDTRPEPDREKFLPPRDLCDDNSTYTMADAVFSACFLNMVLRNADIVGMANFSPVVNTRGAIFTHPGGIVKRSTYYVFDLYTNLMGDEVIDLWAQDVPRYLAKGERGEREVDCVDAVATRRSTDGKIVLALVNKHAEEAQTVQLQLDSSCEITVHTLCGQDINDYNDIDRETVIPFINDRAMEKRENGEVFVKLPAHSVNIVVI